MSHTTNNWNELQLSNLCQAEMMIDYIATFVFFLAVIDPIGTIPVFIAVTNGFSI